MSPIEKSYAELTDAIQKSRGWFRHIVKETGCSALVLSRIANEPLYAPKITEVIKIASWFDLHGVPDCHPRAWAARQRKESAATVAAEAA